MRAVVDNPMLVSLTGEEPRRIRVLSWSIGATFAALSGMLLAPTLGLDAFLLSLLVVQAFGACAIGLFRSLPLTYAGGLVVGVAASVATRYITKPPWTGLPPTMPFLILMGMLVVVSPSRLPGARSGLRVLVLEATEVWRRTALVVGVVGGAALLLVPFVVDAKRPVWTSALSSVVLFGSLALLVWTSGQISLCHMAFAALGATSMSHFTHGAHLPWLVALVLAGLATVPAGIIVALPAIRLSGIYLALATLGFGVLMQNVIFALPWMFSKDLTVTVPRPVLGGLDGTDDKVLYFIVLAVAVACCASIVLIARSRLGRLLRAMAEAPTMLSTHGLSVIVTRMLVFCISAFFAGISGALAITQTGSASGVGYGPVQSMLLIAVLAIAGTRLLRSSILAAALFSLLPAYVTALGQDQETLGFGALAIVASAALCHRDALRAWFARAAATSADRRQHSPVTERHRRVVAELEVGR
jgi:ABC-type branched-subunit amino acid transport system permease subunit